MEDKNVDRKTRNEKAWKTLHGYETTSGCGCWDKVNLKNKKLIINLSQIA